MTNDTPKNIKVEKLKKQYDFMGYYIPHRLLVGFVFIAVLVVVLFDELYASFQSASALNAVIIFTILAVLYLNIENIFKFQVAAKKVNKITTAFKNNDYENYDALLASIEKSVLDTFALKQILKNSFNKNRLTFDDKSAILIKSKVGKRASIMRSNVSHLTGILVMLGLIGTFWGMMGTLSSVGEVLASLSNTLDGDNGLSDLIAGISKPISGMSVAFSSSLFGLAGSLVGSVFNNFVSKGIDRFIEDFGYWVDMHIPIQQEVKSQMMPSKKVVPQTEKISELALGSNAGNGQNSSVMNSNMSDGFNAVAQEIKRSTEMHENLIKQMMEFTSTQLYTSNALKQSLLALNSTQTKTIQLAHSQKITSENVFLELQKLKKIIIQITSQFEGVHISEDLKHSSDIGFLQDRLDFLKQEFEDPELTALDDQEIEKARRKIG